MNVPTIRKGGDTMGKTHDKNIWTRLSKAINAPDSKSKEKSVKKPVKKSK